jgi:hypothetical protein
MILSLSHEEPQKKKGASAVFRRFNRNEPVVDRLISGHDSRRGGFRTRKNVMREPFDDDPSQLRPEWGSGRRRAIATIVDGISKEKGATASAGVLVFPGSIRVGFTNPPQSSQSKLLHGPEHGRENNAPPSLGAQTRGGKNPSGPNGL